MKKQFRIKKLSIFFLTFLLPLSGCSMLGSSSSSEGSFSSESSSSVSEDGSSSSESSSENVSLNWPASVINQTFTASARLTIPAFVSSAPFSYEVSHEIVTTLEIVTFTDNLDGTETYSNQLRAAGWSVYSEYRVTQHYVLAIDSANEMMIFFSYVEQYMVFEIANFDQTLLSSIEIHSSSTWPASEIATTLGGSISAYVPSFASNFGYFYFAEEGYILVFAPMITLGDDAAYSTVLAGDSWIVVDDYYEDLQVYYAYDPSRQVMVMYGIVEGFMMAFIGPFDEDIVPSDPNENTTSEWPSEAIRAVLTLEPGNTIPSYQSDEYHYVVFEDEFGSSISIDSSSATDLTGVYSQALTTLGWTVKQAIVDDVSISWALDETSTTLIVFAYYEGLFLVSIRDFHPELIPGYEAPEVFWPSEEVEELFGDLTVELPEYPSAEGLASDYEFVSGDFPSFTIHISTVSSTSLAEYTERLLQKGFVVYANDTDMTRFAYDPAGQMMVYFFYTDGMLTIQAKFFNMFSFSDYMTSMRESGTLFPVEFLNMYFSPSITSTIPAFETTNGYAYYTDWSTGSPIATILMPETTFASWNDYLTGLTTAGWTITNQTNNIYVVVDATETVRIQVTYDSSTQNTTMTISFTNPN